MNKVVYKLVHDNSKNVLVIEVRTKGTTKGRKRITVQGLKSPDFRYWDKKAECFSSGTDTARNNNPLLGEIKERCNILVSNECITTTSAFVEAYRTETTPTKQTFGEYIAEKIEDMKSAKVKRPSRHYQVYVTLLHKLEREGKIINKPLEEICDTDFIQFGEWILNLSVKEGRNNYRNLMKNFKVMHKRAFGEKLNANHLDYPYCNNAPATKFKKLPSLTKKQYEEFVNLDLSRITQYGIKPDFLKELYHDFSMFIYETKTRPVDALLAKVTDISKINGKYYWGYSPEKKKNFSTTDTRVNVPLTSRALGIVKKYKGQSSQGYVFPFAMNEHDWSAAFAEENWDAAKWHTWNIRKQGTLESVNKWLKKVAAMLFEKEKLNLTLYTFRHSTFTHACMESGANWGRIAMEGGTSIKMLEKNYVTNQYDF